MSFKPFLAVIAFLTIGSLVAGAEEKKNLAKTTNDLNSWRLEQHEAAKAEIAVDADAIVVTIKETTGTDWHVQAMQTGLPLLEGKEYTLSFKAKASADRSVPVNATIDQDDWHAIGLAETAEVTGDWKEFTYTFKAEGIVKDKNRFSLILGGDKGKVWVKEVRLTEK